MLQLFNVMMMVLAVASGGVLSDPAIQGNRSARNDLTGVSRSQQREGRMMKSESIAVGFQPSASGSVTYQPSGEAYLPAAPNEFHLRTGGSFSIAEKGLLFWGVTVLLGFWLASAVIFLCTGKGLIKHIHETFSSFKGRADDAGYHLDAQKLNELTYQVYQAIKAWKTKSQ